MGKAPAEGEKMVEPQKHKRHSRELEDDTPRGIAILALVDLVIKQHESQGCKVSEDGASNAHQGTLGQPAPWRVTGSEEDGMVLGSCNSRPGEQGRRRGWLRL